jgi:hypothetical protein
MLSFAKTSMQGATPVRYTRGGVFLSLPFTVTLGPGRSCVVDFMNEVTVPPGCCATLHLLASYAHQLDVLSDVLFSGRPNPLVATFCNKHYHLPLNLLAGMECVYLVVTRTYEGPLAGALDYRPRSRFEAYPPAGEVPPPPPPPTPEEPSLKKRGSTPHASHWSTGGGDDDAADEELRATFWRSLVVGEDDDKVDVALASSSSSPSSSPCSTMGCLQS